MNINEHDKKEIKGCILLKDKVIIEEQEKEIERLNNIINELENWCNDVMEVLYSFKELDVWDNVELKTLKQVLNKLKELKENKYGRFKI